LVHYIVAFPAKAIQTGTLHPQFAKFLAVLLYTRR